MDDFMSVTYLCAVVAQSTKCQSLCISSVVNFRGVSSRAHSDQVLIVNNVSVRISSPDLCVVLSFW
jgi:hypothetical protein